MASAMSHAPAATAKRLGSRCAVVLHAGHRDRLETQGVRGRDRRFADVELLIAGAEPRHVDFRGVDAGIFAGLQPRLDHEVLGVAVPSLAEAGAAHTEDDDSISNTACHSYSTFLKGRAFQK
jgi:hypothetical protein